MPWLERPRAKIWYEIWPDPIQCTPRVLTLVNGHTRSSSDFRIMGRKLADAGLQVVTLDNRGAGKSEAETPFRVQDFAGDVCALWDHLGIETSELLGISMGGLIAQVIAVNHPERVQRLWLVSTAPDRKWIRGGDSSWVTDAAGIEIKLRDYFAPEFIKRNELLLQAMVKQTQKAATDGDFIARAEAQRAAINAFEPPRIERISCETVVIHGDQDAIVSIEGGKEIVRRIPNAKLKAISGAGHLLLAERPNDLFQIVADG
jgi:3-oxoadipate enol-lactonase